MTNVNQILVNNFRNFKEAKISFDKKLNIFFGTNGSGKTNILESISLLSKGRGLRNANINDLIKKKQENFIIKTSLAFEKNDYDIEISLKKNNERLRKIISVNNDFSKESISHLNSFLSFLIFIPEMERLFQSSPSYRRNFLDRLIFSGNNSYNKLVNKYKKNILERNKILQQNYFDTDWINTVETEIVQIGLNIYNLRNLQIEILNTHIASLNISNGYNFKIKFKIKDDFSFLDLNENAYLAELAKNREYDKNYGGSKIGPHKSDIIATINDDYDASQLSTGQQKTVVLMMLLSQCYYLVNVKKLKPILLFDEICSHLDSFNRKILLNLIDQFDIQLFLTGTDKTLFSFISTNANFYNITEL